MRRSEHKAPPLQAILLIPTILGSPSVKESFSQRVVSPKKGTKYLYRSTGLQCGFCTVSARRKLERVFEAALSFVVRKLGFSTMQKSRPAHPGRLAPLEVTFSYPWVCVLEATGAAGASRRIHSAHMPYERAGWAFEQRQQAIPHKIEHRRGYSPPYPGLSAVYRED